MGKSRRWTRAVTDPWNCLLSLCPRKMIRGEAALLLLLPLLLSLFPSSSSLIFSPSHFSSLGFVAETERRRWRRGGEKEGRMNSPQATTRPERKGCMDVCAWLSALVLCVYDGGGGAREGIENAGVQMIRKYQTVLMLSSRSRVAVVQFGVRATADCTALVTARGQRLSREHLFTLYQTVGRHQPKASAVGAAGLQEKLTIEQPCIWRKKI